VDPRRFGRLEFRDLGRDNLSPRPGADRSRLHRNRFAALFRDRRLSIKAALLNQTCFPAWAIYMPTRVSFMPASGHAASAGRLTKSELERLRLSLRQVLEHAIRLGGSSSPFVDADGVRGFFQLEHCVLSAHRPALPPLSNRPSGAFFLAGRGPISARVASDSFEGLWFFELFALFSSRIQTTPALVINQMDENKRSSKRPPNCYRIGASDVPAASENGQPRTADPRQEQPPTKRPSMKDKPAREVCSRSGGKATGTILGRPSGPCGITKRRSSRSGVWCVWPPGSGASKCTCQLESVRCSIRVAYPSG